MDISGFRPSLNSIATQPSGTEAVLRQRLIEKLRDPNITPDEFYSILTHLRKTESFDPLARNPNQTGASQSQMPEPASEVSGAVPIEGLLKGLRRSARPYSPETNPVDSLFSSDMTSLLGGGTVPMPRNVINFGMGS